MIRALHTCLIYMRCAYIPHLQKICIFEFSQSLSIGKLWEFFSNFTNLPQNSWIYFRLLENTYWDRQHASPDARKSCFCFDPSYNCDYKYKYKYKHKYKVIGNMHHRPDNLVFVLTPAATIGHVLDIEACMSGSNISTIIIIVYW